MSDKGLRCCADGKCRMTMGYYIGGGRYICWLHALFTPFIMQALHGETLYALQGGD